MAHKYSEELRQYSEFLQAGMDMMKDVDNLALRAVKLRLVTSFRRDQMFIQSLLGYPAQSAVEQEKVQLQPLTHILGEQIVFQQPVTQADTTPTEEEKKRFLAEVDDYYKNFPGLADEKLFHKATLPGGEALIRAVARKAGYKDYDRADIDIEYIEAVRQCMEKKQKGKAQKQPTKASQQQAAPQP